MKTNVILTVCSTVLLMASVSMGQATSSNSPFVPQLAIPSVNEESSSADILTQSTDSTPVSNSTTAYTPSASDWEALNKRIETLEKQLEDEQAKDKKKKEKDAQKPTVKISGRIHYDIDCFSQDEESKARAGNMRNGSELRRAWIGASGTYKQFRYKCDFDLAPSSLAFKDVYVGIDSLPLLCDFRVGYYKEPSGVDQLTGVHQMWFIDRPVCMSGISSYLQNRALGISFRNSSRVQNHIWNFGYYQNCSDSIHKHYDEDYSTSDARSGHGFTGRYAYIFQENQECGQLLHLGASFTYKGWDPKEKMNWGTKPEGDLGNKVSGTGDFYGTTDTYMISPELIFTHQSFAVMAEYNYIKLKNKDYSDPEFQGGYVALSYLLTGEHYNYSKADGILTFIKPNEDFCRRCENGQLNTGRGAWQLLYRFSWMDYSNMPLQADANPETSKIGICYDHTIGLNWQMTQTFRMMFNYVFSTDEYKYGTMNNTGHAHIFTTSIQMYF